MVDSISVLHCADLHLGSELTGVPGSALKRRQELLAAFRKITRICRDECIDVLLIAGDMFEGSNVDEGTIQLVKEYLREIPATVTAIAPGNHDYFSIDSPYADDDWPQNVIIFNSGLARAEYRDRGFVLHGAGFTGTYQREPLLGTAAEQPNPDLINICVLHGDLASSGGSSSYNPVSEEQLSASGFQYAALGHIHKRTEIRRAGSCFYAYSGCPEGRGFDELGEKGIYIGSVGRTKVDLEFRSICSRMYLFEEIDISGLESEGEIVNSILTKLRDRYGTDFAVHFYKLRLTGSLEPGFILPLSSISDVLSESLHFVKLADHTHVRIDYEALAKETSLRGIFVRKILEELQAAESADADKAERLTRALELGIMAFDEEVKLDEY